MHTLSYCDAHSLISQISLQVRHKRGVGRIAPTCGRRAESCAAATIQGSPQKAVDLGNGESARVRGLRGLPPERRCRWQATGLEAGRIDEGAGPGQLVHQMRWPRGLLTQGRPPVRPGSPVWWLESPPRPGGASELPVTYYLSGPLLPKWPVQRSCPSPKRVSAEGRRT